MSDWITDSQDEQSLEELFRDTDQIHIPIFQRYYVWKKKQFDELRQDIRLIQDGFENSQFLGAIVAYERPRQTEVVGRQSTLAIVDGQQRILTLYIFVMAIAELWAGLDGVGASEVVQEYLLLPRRRGLEVNTRVVPAFKDRNQFRALWDRLNSPEVLQKKLSENPPRPAPPSGDTTGSLTKQYDRIIHYLREQLPENSDDRLFYLREMLNIVTRQLTFVHLKLNDASAATKIFERLNFRGVRVGIVDLVRNEVFSRVASDPAEAKRIFDSAWSPFEADFKGRSEAFFFPYSLILNSNTKKSELFSQLRESWNGLTSEGIIEHMRPYHAPFMAIDSVGKLPGYPGLSSRLERLILLRRPSVVYPFVMKLLHEVVCNNVSEEACSSTLDGLESFLVRRAIVGFEPTGLHALFKGLWDDIERLSPSGLAQVVSRKPTIQWPSDQEVRAAIGTRPLAKTRICNYLMVEYDKSLPGDHPEHEPTLEHILPQNYDQNGPWSSLFTKQQHKELKDLWANVIPLSNPLNTSLQASEHSIKRDRYLRESMFVTARQVADAWHEWTIETIQERTELLANWALQRWPYSI